MNDRRASADSQQYYIRVRGRVLGPFDLEKLKSLRSRGQFSRIHEISTDGQMWSPASTIDHLLVPARQAKGSQGPKGATVVAAAGGGASAAAEIAPPPAA